MWNMDFLFMQCRGIGPHLVARGNSHGFSRVAVRTRCIFSSYCGDAPSKLVFVQWCQDSCLVARYTSGFSSRLGSSIASPIKVRWKSQCPFPVNTGKLVFQSIFKRSQASSPFEALNSMFLSSCQRDVRPPAEMRQGTRASSSVSTGDSDIPSSFEMKDNPEFKWVCGNPALIRVRASQCPFQLRQQTQDPSHIPIAERSLLLRCLWKGGIPL